MILGEDCYLYIDSSVPESERTIGILCMKCHNDFPTLGSFWEGSKFGYSPYDFICSKCNHVVSSPNTTMKGFVNEDN